MVSLVSFAFMIRKANSLEETLMLREIEGKRRSGWQRVRWLDSVTVSMDMHLSKLRETVEDRGEWYAAVHGVAGLGTTNHLHACFFFFLVEVRDCIS